MAGPEPLLVPVMGTPMAGDTHGWGHLHPQPILAVIPRERPFLLSVWFLFCSGVVAAEGWPWR